MKKSTTLILAGFCMIGLISGFSARRIVSGNPKSADPRESTPTAEIPGEKSAALPAISAPPEIPITRSTDTVSAILAADPAAEYARIALWLATASEADIAAYWAGYKAGKRSVPVTDLIFLNWTRRNPQAAIAAVSGTGDERYAWWSWAANDAPGALAAAKASGKGVALEQAACGIGDFNPAWLLAHLGEIPEEFRGDALDRMTNWPAGLEPRETLDLLRKNGVSFDRGIFKKLVESDPWAALDWMKANPGASDNAFGDNDAAMETLVATLLETRPEDLERLAADTPPGAAKRTMEQALFDRLLRTDPAAALEQARATAKTSPLIAAQQLAQIGLGLVGTEPERAFGIAGEILAANTRSLTIEQMILYPDGGRGYSPTSPATDFIMALFSKDRLKTMEMLSSQQPPGENEMSETFYQAAGTWAQDDLPGFADWTKRQTGKVYEAGAGQVGFKLASEGKYQESIEWAKTGGLAPENAYNAVLYYWGLSDPDAAAAWLDTSDLTEDQKEGYRKTMKK